MTGRMLERLHPKLDERAFRSRRDTSYSALASMPIAEQRRSLRGRLCVPGVRGMRPIKRPVPLPK